MLPKDATNTSNRVSLGLKCSECLHFSTVRASAFDKVCSQLGQQLFSEACPAFTPNMTKISVVPQSTFADIAKIAQKLTQSQTRLFAYVFRNADLVRKAGFTLGEPVVFSLGEDYLECYVRGYMLGADLKAEYCYISSDFETLNDESCLMTLLRPGVMTLKQFEDHRKTLISKGRIAEPKRAGIKRTTLQCLKMSADERSIYRNLLKNQPNEYVPPSIDTVPSTWIDKRVMESVVENRKRLDKESQKRKSTKGKTNGSFKIDRYSK